MNGAGLAADQKLRAEAHLRWALQLTGLSRAPAYKTGEVARLLNVHFNTVKKLTDMWEPEGMDDLRDPRGLESYRVGRRQDRRVSYSALIEWFCRNNSYERQYGEQQELFKI